MDTHKPVHPRTHPSCTTSVQQYAVSGTAVNVTTQQKKHPPPPTHEPTMCVQQYNSSARTYSSTAEKNKNKVKVGQGDLNLPTAEKKQKNPKKQKQGDLNWRSAFPDSSVLPQIPKEM